MSRVQTPLDLATSLSLLGSAAARYVIDGLAEAGFDGVRAGHGYVYQRLLLGPATVGEMAVAIDVSQQAVSKTVKELVLLGYVEQVADAVDRRRHPVQLTDRGQRLIEAARGLRAELDGSIEAVVGTRRLGTTLRVLDELIDLFGLRDRVDARAVTASSNELG